MRVDFGLSFIIFFSLVAPLQE